MDRQEGRWMDRQEGR
ncbi:hypothetical protein BIW11_13253 [Tropilaelaps mercedesae]|uniref:Uncharacterized protein n=1 Tax=Tropilaelaps mercedesae TaxID=418985 RepID=A0A1V9X2M4_9ACAR|nr:hypothetical protein BIW11_13253 [Tropilaelaps mercedesae]